jgi:hypothetical protein
MLRILPPKTAETLNLPRAHELVATEQCACAGLTENVCAAQVMHDVC